MTHVFWFVSLLQLSKLMYLSLWIMRTGQIYLFSGVGGGHGQVFSAAVAYGTDVSENYACVSRLLEPWSTLHVFTVVGKELVWVEESWPAKEWRIKLQPNLPKFWVSLRRRRGRCRKTLSHCVPRMSSLISALNMPLLHPVTRVSRTWTEFWLRGRIQVPSSI